MDTHRPSRTSTSTSSQRSGSGPVNRFVHATSSESVRRRQWPFEAHGSPSHHPQQLYQPPNFHQHLTPPPSMSARRPPGDWSSPEIDPSQHSDAEFQRPGQRYALHDAVMEELEATAVSPPPTSAPADTGANRSRYLREADRREILQRITNGEKQVELAREYGVTRAAICHINKNRDEILARSTRPDVHAAARHPKRRMSRAALFQRQRARQRQVRAAHDSPEPSETESESVYLVRSLALSLHVATLRRRETASCDFRRIANRAIYILLEEALASMPTRTVDVVASDESVWSGVATRHPACAMLMNETGYPMLEVFRSIQPDSPTGSLTLEHSQDRVVLRKMSAPLELRSHEIFLLDATCASARDACVAVQSLVDFGAAQRRIYFVALVISEAAAAEIAATFPDVHIVAAAVDREAVDGTSIGNFVERYFNTTSIRHSASFGSSADV